MHYLTPKNVFVIVVILGMASILGICTLGPSLSGNVGPAGPIPLVSPSQQTLQASANEREIDARYLIKNVGTTNLELGQISTTCGCTAAEVLPRVVPPGGSALVTVKGRPPASGSQQVSIRIASNADPNHEIAMLLTMIGVKPIPYIASASPAVSFGEIDLADIQVFRVETRERLGSKPWLAIPTYSSPLLNVQGGLSSELSR